MMMKTLMRKGFLGVMFTGVSIVAAGLPLPQSNIEVPGDHFSLEGALELFKRSSTPEEFERLLNVPDSKVNNLDLNGDNRTDYIKVIDRYDGHVHAFILQAVISERELQDIAVIELEKHNDGSATLQIVGDADIYGVETIIEPSEEVRVYAGTTTSRRVVNVWAWPVVQYVYDPYYSVWISPWGWYSRPVWYYPWRPVSYVVYRPYWDPYRPYYSHCYYHRNVYAQRIYVPVRTTSVIVYSKHHDNVVRSRNTRGRDYDRDGYYRGEDRNRSRPQDVRTRSYDNSRDYVERERGNDSRDRSAYSGRERDSGSQDHSSSDRSTYQHIERNSSVTVTPRSESKQSFSRPRDTQSNSTHPRVGVSRSSSDDSHRPSVSPRSHSSQSNSRSHSSSNSSTVTSSPRQSHSSSHVQSGGSHRSSPAQSGGSSHGSGPAKRGRD